jgi:serine/threonine protein kinase
MRNTKREGESHPVRVRPRNGLNPPPARHEPQQNRSLSRGTRTKPAEGQEWKFRAKKVLGTGTFGVVQLALLEDGQEVAVKRVLQDAVYKNREMDIVRLLDHPHIVPVLHQFLARES